ncbi:IS66 family insertion sequence element accessory protein TnpA, partial [Effusibacillus lacus]
MTQADLRETWKARIEAYRASGQRASEWCAIHQVTTRQLWYWIRKLKDTDKKPARQSQWVTVNVDNQTVETESSLLVKVGSVAIEVMCLSIKKLTTLLNKKLTTHKWKNSRVDRVPCR